MKARINGQEYEFTANETILEVARRNGIFIPTLCEMHDIRHAPAPAGSAWWASSAKASRSRFT